MQDVKKDRNLYIGGSDIPIILGISPFKTRFDLLLEKAGLKEDTFEGNKYTKYGNEMEEKIRKYVNMLLKSDFKEDKYIQGDIRCHYDGIDNEAVLEIKTTSQIHEEVNDYKVYLSQLLFYMQYANKQNGVLAVYERTETFDTNFDSSKLHIYGIELDQYGEFLTEINKEVDRFRIDLEKVKNNPLISEEELLPSNVNEISGLLVRIEEELKFYDEMLQRRDNLKERLRNIMIENNIKSIPVGTLKITNVLDGEDKEISKFNETKFKEENAELYNKYLELKIQKGRKGYIKITKGEE